MKKIVSIALALVVLSAVLVGCKGEETTTTDPGTGTTKTQPTGTQAPETTN